MRALVADLRSTIAELRAENERLRDEVGGRDVKPADVIELAPRRRGAR